MLTSRRGSHSPSSSSSGVFWRLKQHFGALLPPSGQEQELGILHFINNINDKPTQINKTNDYFNSIEDQCCYFYKLMLL